MTVTTPATPDALRVGNCSGFYGDRLSAMREMLKGGELDVLTGDYLAELTMMILGRDRAKDPTTGYAKTFLRQLEDCLALAMDRGVTIVSNAGGVNPAGLAQAIRDLGERLGLSPRVAHVEGDDLTGRAAELGLGTPMAANAYLGAFGIARALGHGGGPGADVVVTGRVTDASVIIGPAIAHFGWGRTDYDALAGATVAGHVIECGTQATGGNYAFFTELVREGRDLTRPGFPIAEIRIDGSSVITKHAGTGGAVTTETVLSQLLYEITDARYAGPDVVTRLDSIRLTQEGPDRVLIDQVVGEAPPPDVKVSCTAVGGYRNEVTFVLTGLDIEAKAELAQRQVEAVITDRPAELSWTLVRHDRADAPTEEQASALLRLVARDADAGKVGRAISGAAVETALGSYPGFHTTAPPGRGAMYGAYTPAYVPQEVPAHTVVLSNGETEHVDPPVQTAPLEPAGVDNGTAPATTNTDPTATTSTDTVRIPLGHLLGARSGDKGGNANVGLWARDDAAWEWAREALTAEALTALLPEAEGLRVTRAVLPNLRSLNFVIEGLLGEGVAYNARFDPQAKGVAEWVRSRYVDVPRHLVEALETPKELA